MSDRQLATLHLCEGFDRDEYDFWQGRCTCGNYVTAPVPDLDLAVDELMAHSARAALEAVTS